MPKSQWGYRVAQGVSASAEARKCPECGRHGALVEAWRDGQKGTVCHWARDHGDRLCSFEGYWRPLPGAAPN
jgi:hypothetical protein